jgi:predicted RecA/RadA family phage recombinase
MKNSVQMGKVLTWKNATGSLVKSGTPVVTANRVFVATGDIKDGEEGELLTEEVVRLAKTTGQAYVLGTTLYWDPTGGGKLTSTAGSLKAIGYAAGAYDNAATFANVKLCALTV